MREIWDLRNHEPNEASKWKEIPEDGHAVDLESQTETKFGILELWIECVQEANEC